MATLALVDARNLGIVDAIIYLILWSCPEPISPIYRAYAVMTIYRTLNC